MTIGLDHPKQILKAQTEARKLENIKSKDVGGVWLHVMTTKAVIKHESHKSKYSIIRYLTRCQRHEHKIPTVCYTTREYPQCEVGQHNHDGFCHKASKSSQGYELFGDVDATYKVCHFYAKRKQIPWIKLARNVPKEVVSKHGILSHYLDRDPRFGAERDMIDSMEALHTVEALYGRKCRSPMCCRGGQVQLTGPELVQESTERIIQIKQRIQTARDRQKSYANLKRKPMEFQVGDKVMLKVSPWKGVVRFGKRGNRSVNTPVDDKLYFVEEPVEVMDHEVKQLRRSRVPIVKVRWNSRRGPEFTWEREDQFRKKYPHLFTKTAPSSSAV
ncbi:hypothetical protein Tco_1055940 [Tanacetum coccineum]|uniref:Reverse transcriptase domain-containing protein n=1 Tax=Tanacetum coccineum TaxID=301880 RepID=A0ABQ5H135_9ASTR